MVALGRSYLFATIAFLYLPIAVMVVMAFNASALYELPIQPSLHWFANFRAFRPLHCLRSLTRQRRRLCSRWGRLA